MTFSGDSPSRHFPPLVRAVLESQNQDCPAHIETNHTHIFIYCHSTLSAIRSILILVNLKKQTKCEHDVQYFSSLTFTPLSPCSPFIPWGPVGPTGPMSP